MFCLVCQLSVHNITFVIRIYINTYISFLTQCGIYMFLCVIVWASVCSSRNDTLLLLLDASHVLHYRRIHFVSILMNVYEIHIFRVLFLNSSRKSDQMYANTIMYSRSSYAILVNADSLDCKCTILFDSSPMIWDKHTEFTARISMRMALFKALNLFQGLLCSLFISA